MIAQRRWREISGVDGIHFCGACWGWGFNEGLSALIAEVTNTPWGDRHRYVAVPGQTGGPAHSRLTERLHGSPFMGMDQSYELVASAPGDTLEVRIASEQGGRRVFEASLALRRRELTRRAMSRVMARPSAPALTLARIYLQALRLRLAGVPAHPRPRRT